MISNAVFELTSEMVPPFDVGFESVNALPESAPRNRNKTWKPKRFSTDWSNVQVIGKPHPENDYPCINLICPAVSERAVKVLGELLRSNGEILPITVPVGIGRYFAYNITTIIDALDLKRTSVRSWMTSRYGAIGISEYYFKRDALPSIGIFRLPEEASKVFVTASFAELVHQSRLKGFRFVKI